MFDNLQLSIKKIHIRFEKNSSNQVYSFGCTSESLELYTVDSNHQKMFIDRSKLKDE